MLDFIYSSEKESVKLFHLAQILLLLENGKTSFSHLTQTLKKQATRTKVTLGLPHDFVIHMYRRLYSHLGQTLKPSMMSGSDLSIGFSIEECMSSPCVQYHDHYIKSSQAVGDVYGRIVGTLRLSYTHYNIASKMYTNSGPSQDESLEKAFNYCLECVQTSLYHNFYNFAAISLLQAASVLECYRELSGARDPQFKVDVSKEAKKISSVKETCFLDWDNWTQTRLFSAIKTSKNELNSAIIQYRWLGIMIMITNLYVVSKEELLISETLENPNNILRLHFDKVSRLNESGHILAFLGDQDEAVYQEIFKVLEITNNHVAQIQDWLDGIHK
eukprot:NODE_64_length_26047_cov_1.706837.p7 type:complete len:330 gc:universal NODE_64_length_26047_cov_1.706837:20043-21032(+)